MALLRWDPFREVAALERQFDEMFGRMGERSASGTQPEPESAPDRSSDRKAASS